MQHSDDLETAGAKQPVDVPADFYGLAEVHDIWYTSVLQSIHENLHPQRYFEIGTALGDTLALAQCASLAVDPAFNIGCNVTTQKSACLLFQMTSDAFFRDYNVKALLGGPIDFAFLDGMHWFEFLLRDFINTEKNARTNSIIMLHDCIPGDSHIARRNNEDARLAPFSSQPDWWAGDVWKVVAILQKYRPKLHIYGCRAAPTGLIAVTNLDPGSTVLQENYFDITKEYKDVFANKTAFGAYIAQLNIVETREFFIADVLASRFWL